ncbi:NAD-dependent epimerase/dehydratase family protein [Croceitalea vernalis]|uniref:SDR family NAD(P)-dependent oxidoreductase n=1 Tax=Croceitalea vernalis TaxID=3075599 RepID=A0ABU3BF53_9FLAO|nr:NAD-dependent epimerase/dehydratase family protein [Croceitalea sp. P007]MDT0620786.1 SDR family NAD(P)-dependent oxidoreductase [Croceitalea sp. P007]
MSKTIGVLGCGWLGQPLAQSLVLKGHQVKGSTTSTDKFKVLENLGISPYHIKLTEEKVEGNITSFLQELEVLIVNIPPGLRKTGNGSFIKRIEMLLRHVEDSKIDNVLFVSSTSVYGAVEGDITEETNPNPITNSGKQLAQIEKLLLANKRFDTTIIRFGGLIGPNRHPINHLAGRTGLTNGCELINLIHLDDCILMIETILNEAYWGSIFNGVYPYHPTKKDYYTREAEKRGLDAPQFIKTEQTIFKKTIKSHLFYVKSHQLLTTIVS